MGLGFTQTHSKETTAAAAACCCCAVARAGRPAQLAGGGPGRQRRFRPRGL